MKSGIIYIKHLFNENGRLKTLNEFSTIIQNKSNWLCEYKIIQDVLKKNYVAMRVKYHSVHNENNLIKTTLPCFIIFEFILMRLLAKH